MRNPDTYRGALRPLVLTSAKLETKEVTIDSITKIILNMKGDTTMFLRVLKVLAGFAYYSNIPFVNPMLIKVQKKYDKEISYVDDGDIEDMCTICDDTNFLGVRNQTIIKMLYETGARLNELLRINLADLEGAQLPHVKITTEKSGEFGVLVWSPETHELLLTYLGMRISRDWTTDKLFINKNGSELTDRGVEHMVAKIGRAALGRRVHPHEMRHGRGRKIILMGGGLTGVQKKLRHKHIQSTMVYTRLDFEQTISYLEKYSK